MKHHFGNNSQVNLNSTEHKQYDMYVNFCLKPPKLNCFFHQLKQFWEGKSVFGSKETTEKRETCEMHDDGASIRQQLHTETMPAELLLARHRVVWMTAAEGCLVPNCPPDPWRPPAHRHHHGGDDSIPSRGRTYGSRAFCPFWNKVCSPIFMSM